MGIVALFANAILCATAFPLIVRLPFQRHPQLAELLEDPANVDRLLKKMEQLAMSEQR